jgi:hypothetical protein
MSFIVLYVLDNKVFEWRCCCLLIADGSSRLDTGKDSILHGRTGTKAVGIEKKHTEKKNTFFLCIFRYVSMDIVSEKGKE